MNFLILKSYFRTVFSFIRVSDNLSNIISRKSRECEIKFQHKILALAVFNFENIHNDVVIIKTHSFINY